MHGEHSEFEMITGTRAVLDLLGGKWTIEVLYLLAALGLAAGWLRAVERQVLRQTRARV